jgi:hypothetical protein
MFHSLQNFTFSSLEFLHFAFLSPFSILIYVLFSVPNDQICRSLCRVAAPETNGKIFLGNIDKKWKKEDVSTTAFIAIDFFLLSML